MPTFEELRDKCLRNGTLFEDPDFQANDSTLYFIGDKPITWRRPGEIVEKPVFIREATYYDLNQGDVGDCFFLSAVNSLIANDRALFNKVLPRDQSFVEKYAGIFRFNFWQYGEWKEVYVDDRLPMKGERLAYSRNRKEPDEFWICLLEKAFAKLHGSYRNIDGGILTDVLVDLTGGISEYIMLKDTEYNAEQLFNMIFKMWKMDTLISLGIYQSEDGGREWQRANGLVEGHAYSVTRLATVSVAGKTERLIRIRNPWGQHEWKGAWSDKSGEWAKFSEEDRKKIGITVRDEGEFWMNIEDLMSEFDSIVFCHKEESAFSEIVTDPDAQKAKWSSNIFKDRWVKNISSGGSDVEKETYWRNPQYVIDLSRRTEHTWVVISLMEVMPRDRKLDDLRIGFDILQMKSGSTVPQSYRFDEDSVKLFSFCTPSIRRERSKCYELPPGIFVVIVYNKEMITSDFLVRIYSECAITVRPADDVTQPFTEDEKLALADPLDVAFEKYCDKIERNVDASALKFIISQVWSTEFQVNMDFTLESCRCLMCFADYNHHGVIDIKGVRQVVKIITTWIKVFLVFDKDHSMSIETGEFMRMLKVLGLNIGRKVAESSAIRYGGRNGRIKLDDFIQCVCRLFTLAKSYEILGLSNTNVSLGEYISEALKV